LAKKAKEYGDEKDEAEPLNDSSLPLFAQGDSHGLGRAVND